MFSYKLAKLAMTITELDRPQFGDLFAIKLNV